MNNLKNWKDKIRLVQVLYDNASIIEFNTIVLNSSTMSCHLYLLLLLTPFTACGHFISSFDDRRYVLQHKQLEGVRLNDWPCPLAEEIAPCTCSSLSSAATISLNIDCDGLVDIQEIERVFSAEFPFNNLNSISLIVNDKNVWDNTVGVIVPQNVFKDKTAKVIWISIKIKEVHPLAFENTAEKLEDLSFSGPGWVDGYNPLNTFPLHMLEHFPNLKWFMLQSTMITDSMFSWNEDNNFSNLILSNLGECYEIT